MMSKILRFTLVVLTAILLLTTVSFADPQLPKPQGFMNDFAGKLNPSTKQQIETLLSNFRDRTGIEVAVVTVNFDDMQGYPIEDYTLRLGRDWGIGRDAQKRSLILLVAIKPPDAQGVYHGGTRLEVSRQLEGDVPDILAGEVIRKMRDDFVAGRFDQALTNGTQTILATVAQRLGISIDGVDQTQAARQPGRQPVNQGRKGRGIPLFAIVIVIFVVFSIIRSLTGGGRGGGGRWGGIGSDLLLWSILFGGRGGGGWGGSRGDSGSSWGGGSDSGGGDFGGFGGGGDFGGGGSSDSW